MSRDPNRRVASATGVICAWASLGALSTGIFLPALPRVAADLHATPARATAAVSLFLAVLALGQLLVGPLCDRFGRRTPALVGLGLFVLGSLWAARAGDLAGLLAGRGLQACGASIATVLARALASDRFAGRDFTRAMSAITIATAIAPGLSPLIGAAVARVFGWRADFLLVAAVGVCTLIACQPLVRGGRTSAPAPLAPGVVVRAYVALLRDPAFAAPSRTAGLLMAGLYALLSAAPVVLSARFGYAASQTSVVFAGLVALVLVAAGAAPALSVRLGLARATGIGLSLAAAGAVGVTMAIALAPGVIAPFLLAAAAFVGGLGLASPLASGGALGPFRGRAGVAAALFGFTQMTGAAMGAALAAAVARDPAVGLSIVLCGATSLALALHVRARRMNPGDPPARAAADAVPLPDQHK